MNKRPPKISQLSPQQRDVLLALIECWLVDTEAGRLLLRAYTIEESQRYLCELYDAGMVRFVKNKRGFSVIPVLPMGGREGSRA